MTTAVQDLLVALSPPSRTQIWVQFAAVALLLLAVGLLAVTSCERVPPEPARPARKPDAPAPGRKPGRVS